MKKKTTTFEVGKCYKSSTKDRVWFFMILKNFAISGSAVELTNFNYNSLVNHVADYGMDVTSVKEIRRLFPTIFKN